jgi:hypothetical protein
MEKYIAGKRSMECKQNNNLIQQWKTILWEKRRVACLTLEPGEAI